MTRGNVLLRQKDFIVSVSYSYVIFQTPGLMVVDVYQRWSGKDPAYTVEQEEARRESKGRRCCLGDGIYQLHTALQI